MTETKLIAKENVRKLMNSKDRYLKIPENAFNTITHGDIAEVIKRENDNHTDLIYRFKKVIVEEVK